jgi:hypothetical protein
VTFLFLIHISQSAISSSWTLYHSVLSSSEERLFEKRGSITLTIPDEGAAAVLEIDNHAEALSNSVSELLVDVATPKFYQLKLVSDENPSLPPVMTTVPACQVLRANFRYDRSV